MLSIRDEVWVVMQPPALQLPMLLLLLLLVFGTLLGGKVLTLYTAQMMRTLPPTPT